MGQTRPDQLFTPTYRCVQLFSCRSTIRDKIIPHAVSWFIGDEAAMDEYGDIEDDENIDEDDGEEEDEETKNRKKVV